ncbi:DUF1611 domain-containing protein [Blastococcus brunescens]|uniref:DUF1611 domain-containing protein n=1 Tax=Blastococcus brunescens TaxID=1564165 RepID=A0ABZ1B0A7_9ACTN|nr:DUF1611 domain-containing protein [Blastococcus sp. BMG 8361]WRL64154.1 DUF1611 domain-containing protein [Blastococcus sp. BMG 8361]
MTGERLAVLTGGQLTESFAKTAHGVLRYGTREVVCVIDAAHAGQRAVDVVPFCASPAPVVADVGAARDLGATTVLLGVAPFGGQLTAAWRDTLLTAIGLGMHVEAGLHTDLRADPELAAAARAAGVEIRDLRAVPADLGVPLAAPVAARVVHTVGSDCAIGKMSVVLELDRAARDRGLGSVFVATGQTGVAISGWGMAVDHVISDFVAGAADRLVREGRPAATCSGWRARARSTTRPTPGSPSACCTGRRPMRSCCATARGAPPSSTTPARRCRRWRRSCAATSRRPAGSAPRGSRPSPSTPPGWTTTPRGARSTTPRRRPGWSPTTSSASAPAGCWTPSSPRSRDDPAPGRPTAGSAQ